MCLLHISSNNLLAINGSTSPGVNMEIQRMVLLMLHVVFVMGAVVGIAFADLSLFKDHKVDARLLRTGCHLVMAALGMLWVTGLLIVWLDTGFDLQVIASKPKLVTKIGVVLLCTLNGALLHRYFFASLERPPIDLRKAANWAAVMAAVSGASWLYAGFLGMAKPLAKLMDLPTFASLYLVVLLIGGLLVAWIVQPRVLQIYRHISVHG
jgi:hypothetical protein